MSGASPKLSATIPIVPLPAIEISGSLFPFERGSGVLVKVRPPIDVLPNVTSTANTMTPRIAANDFPFFRTNTGFIPSESHRFGPPAARKGNTVVTFIFTVATLLDHMML
jgi:hypothetical protein